MESKITSLASSNSVSADITKPYQSSVDKGKRKQAPSSQDNQEKKVKTGSTTTEEATEKSVFNYHTIRKLSQEDNNSRYIDSEQLPLSFAPNDPISAEDMNKLDYRVVPQQEKIRDKLLKASHLAAEYWETRPFKVQKNLRFSTWCRSNAAELKDIDPVTQKLTKGLWGSCFQLQNFKKEQPLHPIQDDFVYGEQEALLSDHQTSITYAGVFDGHGKESENLAKFASSMIMRNIYQCIKRYTAPDEICDDTVIWNAQKIGFVNCDRYLNQIYERCGTTASVSSIFHNNLWTANTGDSLQLLLKPDGSYTALTEAFLPNSPERKGQIEKRGGSIAADNRRILSASGKHSLAMARSLGDKSYCGVPNPRPKIIKTIKPQDGWDNHFLLMGTDGLWDIASSDAICTEIKHLQSRGKTIAAITQILGLAARKAGSDDDITVALIDLRFMDEGQVSSIRLD